jgi:hypothetical protein
MPDITTRRKRSASNRAAHVRLTTLAKHVDGVYANGPNHLVVSHVNARSPNTGGIWTS